MHGMLPGLTILICVALFLGGCSLYNHPYSTAKSSVTSPAFDLHIVQADDFGSFWDSREAGNVIAAVENEANSTNAFVMVFVHGWHHNSDPTDDNLLDFKESLGQLAAQFSQPLRRATRQELTGTPDIKIIGIYIGWRGRSLPGVLDYLTMWWRKDAAERVGDGDVAEFLERLQRIYLRANAFKRYEQNYGKTPFMGLVTIGHSFGGQVVLKSVSHAFESDLTKRASCLTDAVTLPSAPQNPEPERIAIDSFGDLNILLNPALEAYQFARIDGLYRQLSYPTTQSPQLVVFSADNDWARKTFFSIARAITRPFRPAFRNPYQGALWGKALGELPSQQTHDLRIATGEADALTDQDYSVESRHKIAEYDFTDETVFSGVKLSRMPSTHIKANSPVAVVVTHDKIIDGHNGIFEPRFKEFLAPYIAYIEGKRVVLRYERFKEQKKAAETDAVSGNDLCSK
jgi:hypothetical protein